MGQTLGRLRQPTGANQAELKATRERIRRDELDCIPIEGKFGNAKRKGSLARIMAKLPHTSLSIINIGLIMLNLDTWLREVLFWLLNRWDRLGFESREGPSGDLRTPHPSLPGFGDARPAQ